jgi:hypothetical protein
MTLVRPHLNRVVRVKSFALATNGCQVKVAGHCVVQSAKVVALARATQLLSGFMKCNICLGFLACSLPLVSAFHFKQARTQSAARVFAARIADCSYRIAKLQVTTFRFLDFPT